MSTSAATETSIPDLCPCGLTQEQLEKFRLVGEGGVCTAWGRGSNKQVKCGELFVDHPTTDLGLKKRRHEECIVHVRCLKRQVDDVPGETLEMDGVPVAILNRYAIANKVLLYCRRCYISLYEYIKGVMLDEEVSHPVMLVSGVPGIGKSFFSIYFMVQMMLDDDFPLKECFFEFDRGLYSKFKCVNSTVTTAEETDQQVKWTGEFTLQIETCNEINTQTDLLLSDMIAVEEPRMRGRWTCIFSSPNPLRYKETIKVRHYYRLLMPTWSEEELQFVDGNIDNWYERFAALGGIPRTVLWEGKGSDPFMKLQEAFDSKSAVITDFFFSYGIGGRDTQISHMLVHTNPPWILEKDDWDYMGFTVFSFASDEIFWRLSKMFERRLLNQLISFLNARVASEMCGGGTAGNLFEKVILWLKPIAGQTITLVPLTAGSAELTVTLPALTLLPRNWKSKNDVDKLSPGYFYQPRVSNLESGDCFCIMQHNGELVLVVLQVTVGKRHPIKANGLKAIV